MRKHIGRKRHVAATMMSVSMVGSILAADLIAQARADAAVLNPWMAPNIVSQQSAASNDAEKEAIANSRAKMLISAMSIAQKMQQLTGSRPELLSELPNCYGARHVGSIPSLSIPTFRISNGPVGVGQNDCVSRSVYDDVVAGRAGPNGAYRAYTHPSSAKATALPSALGAAASFDPAVAAEFGDVIATEMNNLALHVFEAPGVNLARLPILGRNFEYFGEDPYLSGVMAAAEVKAVQSKGLIAMPKHYIANEQETRRQTIQTSVDEQVLREIYLLPFEMAVKDGRASAIMCAYNYLNGISSCENKAMLTDVLRKDWGFTGYVQTDFFAMKSTAAAMKAGLDHEMPTPQFWAPDKLSAALDRGEISVNDINLALERRYTHMFKHGIFDRPLVQSPIDFAAGGRKARDIGTKSAVLLQNNGALPLSPSVRSLVLIGKSSQVYAQQAVAGGSMRGQPMGAGGGSSDVVPDYTISPMEGLVNALKQHGNGSAKVKLILVDDANASATVDGKHVSFQAALAEIAAADSVIMMAGTISEEGADRATFADADGRALAANAAAGSSLDWYAEKLTVVATNTATNPAKNSNTVAMIRTIMATPSLTARAMAEKSILVLKDNAGVAMDPSFVGKKGPAILEVWFPGQEDGNIVADLILGVKNPSGKLPVTFPYSGNGFLDSLTALQFPGQVDQQGQQRVAYSEGLNIGYRWYDANVSGKCAVVNGRNPCVAFPFGFGLSYTTFTITKPRVSFNPDTKTYRATATITNTGKRSGSEVLQAYVSLPQAANSSGATQPPKRLIGFQKVELAPGASKEIVIAIDPSASHHPLSVWNSASNRWVTPAGSYVIWLGNSSAPRDLLRAGSFSRKAE